MYHKLEAGEVYTLTSCFSGNWVKFIVSDTKKDNYGHINKYYIHVLDHRNFNYDKNKTCTLYPNSGILHKEESILKHHETSTIPLDKKEAQLMLNYMLKHEAVKQNNKKWFNKLCKESENLLA